MVAYRALGRLGVTFFGTMVAAIFSLKDEVGYDRYVTDQLAGV